MTAAISRERNRRARRAMQADRSFSPKPWLSAALVGVLTWAGAMLLSFYPRLDSISRTLAPGQRSPLTVVSTFDFQAPDLDRTELSRQQAADAVPPVFKVAVEPILQSERVIDKLFRGLRLLRMKNADEAVLLRETADLLDILSLPISPDNAVRLLDSPESDDASRVLKGVVHETMLTGILAAQDRDFRPSTSPIGRRIQVVMPEDERRRDTTLDAIPTPAEAAVSVCEKLQKSGHFKKIDDESLERFLRALLPVNLSFDPTLTADFREQARRTVENAVSIVPVGTPIVESGQIVTPQILQRLKAYEARRNIQSQPSEHALRRIGQAGLLVLALFASFALLRLARRDLLEQRRLMVLFLSISLLTLFCARLLEWISAHYTLISPAAPPFLTPVALAPLMGAVLAGGPLGAAVGLWTSCAVSLLNPHAYAILFMGLIETVAAILASDRVRKRSQMLRAGLWIGLGKLIYAVFADLTMHQPASILGWQLGSAFGSGLLSAGLALLLIPFFEYVFHITTDIHWLELSDPSHPLLRRLAEEAPGTYHHSLMVASLAQSGAEAIGANSLMARVCAYYHDIGKLTKPVYFTENVAHGENPHDELSPHMSRLVVMSHVKEGVSLAMQYRLPPPVIDAIQQHHGTSVVRYFYHRAQQQRDLRPAAHDEPPVEEEQFRYPGPLPHSREMAILSLADSVEAASRSMSKPNPARLQSLVDDIFARRLQDGQLDASALTLADLAAIRKSFVFTLTNMLHGRIAYPGHAHQDSQPPAAPADPVLPPGEPRPGADGTGLRTDDRS